MNIVEKDRLLTVTQLTRSIKNILESKLRFIKITGEVSNLRTPFSGHSYFTLKDSSAQIRAVLFKQQKRFLDMVLKDGQEVICFGRITVYEPRGEYQLVVDSVELFGTGQLQIEFEQLKSKLSALGYFDSAIKKELPLYPQKIVVISSPTGAAIQDFLKIVRDRKSPVTIQILPVKVQGHGAATEIAHAIKIANELPQIDVIVLCRGGGSLEDLWAFNEEVVAEAIHKSAIPVVTGVGHEIDFTIADFCGDFRCPTPTAVAETLVVDATLLADKITTQLNSLSTALYRKIENLDQQLQHGIRLLGNMDSIFSNAGFRLQLSKSYLLAALEKYLTNKERRLQLCRSSIEAKAPTARIALQEKNIQMMKNQLFNQMERIIARKRSQLGQQATLLNSVSPLATLGRGYSIVRRIDQRREEYRIISDSADTEPGDELNILLNKGEIDCVVRKTS